MKIILKINKKKDLDHINNCDSFLLSIERLSSSYDYKFKLEEILNLKEKYSDKEIFLNLNKNFQNDELEELEIVLKLLNNQGFKILFYDLAVLELKNKLNLNLDLVWAQDYLVTNYREINFFNDYNVNYALISNEITFDEIKEIVNNSKSKLIVNLIVKARLASSKRKLLSYNYINQNREKKTKELLKNNEYEIVVKESDDLIIEDSKFSNHLRLLDLDLDYGIVDLNDLDNKYYDEILNNLNNYQKTKDDKFLEDISAIIGKDEGFLNKKTIYKVVK